MFSAEVTPISLGAIESFLLNLYLPNLARSYLLGQRTTFE
jgi:uncharacterized membrane protein YgaE (UPF0421/DUF939 family)